MRARHIITAYCPDPSALWHLSHLPPCAAACFVEHHEKPHLVTHTPFMSTTCYMQLASHPLMSLYIFWPALECNPSLIKYAIMQASHTGMRE